MPLHIHYFTGIPPWYPKSPILQMSRVQEESSFRLLTFRLPVMCPTTSGKIVDVLPLSVGQGWGAINIGGMASAALIRIESELKESISASGTHDGVTNKQEDAPNLGETNMEKGVTPSIYQCPAI